MEHDEILRGTVIVQAYHNWNSLRLENFHDKDYVTYSMPSKIQSYWGTLLPCLNIGNIQISGKFPNNLVHDPLTYDTAVRQNTNLL